MYKIFLPVGVLSIIMLATAPALADGPGKLANASSNYKVRNLTANGDYAASVNASCNDTVKYSVTLTNSDTGKLSNVAVKANFNNGSISALAENGDGKTTGVKGTAQVKSAGNMQYVSGSTVRVDIDQKDTNKQTPTKKSDGIDKAGVNVGSIEGPAYIFVQFEAKVICSAAQSSAQAAKPASPATTNLADTGPGSIAAIVSPAVLVGIMAYYWMLRRLQHQVQ